MIRNCLAVVAFLAFTVPSFAGEVVSPTYSPDVAHKLVELRIKMVGLEEAAKSGVIAKGQLEAGTTQFLGEASKFVGHPMTLVELSTVSDPGGSTAQLTAVQRFAGLITFANTLWVIAILGMVLFGTILVGSLVVDLIKVILHVPAVFYEVLFYLLGAMVVVYGHMQQASTKPYIGLTGCLFLAGGIGLTKHLHKNRNFTEAMVAGILTVIWTPIALWYGSSMIGFIAVLALFVSLGFSGFMDRLTIGVGFDDESALGRATTVAFLLLAGFVGVRIAGTNVWVLDIFEFGALFLGSFVGYLGLLINSTRWYGSRRYGWVAAQVVAIVAGVAAIGIGSIFHIGELQKIGGTFFILYLLEKVIEVPVESLKAKAGLGLVVSGAIYGICMYVKANPETVRPWFLIVF